MQELKLGRIYRHFKGDHYLVEAAARDAGTGGELVVYRKLYDDGALWVRPTAEFLEELDPQKYPNAGQRHRFELLDIPSVAGH